MSKERLKALVIPVLRQYGVLRAALFGSIARGDATETSDVDLLVEFGPDKSLLDLIALKLDLQERIGTVVDVVTYAALHPSMRNEVLRNQEIIYEAPAAGIS